MAPGPNTRLLIFWTLALLTGLSGGIANADPLYNVTNLGSGTINLTTAGGGTIAVSPTAWPPVDSIATSQVTSVSNGQVSYSFTTTPDTPLIQGQGPLSSVPAGSEVSGFLNANGFAALASSDPLPQGQQLFYDSANAAELNPDGTFTSMGLITSSPFGVFEAGAINIAGINLANQVLVGTSFPDRTYDALVYNIGTQTLTDLDLLPVITGGLYSNLMPVAIGSQGQILVRASPMTPGGPLSDILLLTPGDAPPEPLAMPEPASCVLWGIIVFASCVATKRARSNR